MHCRTPRRLSCATKDSSIVRGTSLKQEEQVLHIQYEPSCGKMLAVSEKKGCSVRLPDTQRPNAKICFGSPSRQAASELEGGKLCLQHRRDEGVVIDNPRSPRQHSGSPRCTPSSLAALLRRLPRHLVVCIAHDAHEKPDKAQPRHAKVGIRSACRRPTKPLYTSQLKHQKAT